MISSRILTQTCTIYAITGQSFDSVGCPVSSLTTSTVSGIPCYFTETTYETKDGKEPIKNVYLMYVPYLASTSGINTSFKILAEAKTFDVLNVEQTHNNAHLEMIVKEISI
jgi:hypothetical protein